MNHDITVKSSPSFTFIEKAYIPNTSYFLVITEELMSLIEEYFSASVPQFTLVNNLRFDTPCTTSSYDEIHISCMDTSWSQIVFQLSHEFCHLMIGRPVTENLRWFEESIAEVSSLFFMSKLADGWKTKGILGCPDYADSLRKYVCNRINSVATVANLSDATRTSSLRNRLISDPYNRILNLQIAVKMLPVFNKNPYMWKIVPCLGLLSANQCFSQSFTEWKNLCDKHMHSALDDLQNCFTVDSTN